MRSGPPSLPLLGRFPQVCGDARVLHGLREAPFSHGASHGSRGREVRPGGQSARESTRPPAGPGLPAQLPQGGDHGRQLQARLAHADGRRSSTTRRWARGVSTASSAGKARRRTGPRRAQTSPGSRGGCARRALPLPAEDENGRGQRRRPAPFSRRVPARPGHRRAGFPESVDLGARLRYSHLGGSAKQNPGCEEERGLESTWLDSYEKTEIVSGSRPRPDPRC